jgi:glycerophosphoryl diester phosphodiesterase
MKTELVRIAIILLIIVSISCERVTYFPDNPIVGDKTYMLAHKGGGSFDEGNTMEACIYGLTMADGIEVDIQKSSDNDLWLNHSSKTSSCGSFKEMCFPSTTSSTIIQIDTCLGNHTNYTMLEDVFAYMQKNYPEKFISLDVKAWSPCGISNLNVIHEMNQLAQSIINLTAKYHLENHVMVESESGDFLYYIKKHSDHIETYLATLGDFELGISRALDAGFSGVSFKYKFDEPINKELIDLMHRKGLKIQLWTVDAADLEEAKLIGPDFIQTDSF